MPSAETPTNLKSDDPRTGRFSGELLNRDMEHRFRLWRYDAAIIQHRIVAWLIVLAAIPFIIQVWRAWGGQPEFYILTSLRLVAFGFAVLGLVWSHQRRSYQRLDMIALLTLSSVLLVNAAALAVADSITTMLIVQMLLVTTFAYILYPGRLIHSVGPLTVFTACFVTALFLRHDVAASDLLGLVTWSVIVNSAGFLAARQFNVFRRREFLAVTEAREQAAELENARATAVQARREAEQANRAKSAMLANTSHELRTPLNAIIGFSDMIDQEMLGPIGNTRYRQYASDIHNSGRHLLSLIDDLLDIAKIESGKTEFHEEWLDLREETEVACRMANAKAVEKQQRIVCVFDSAVADLFADQRAVRQVLLNLLSNAIKFSDQGEVVTLRWSEGSDGRLSMAVEDNGPGIDAAQIQRIMRPFEQIEVDPTKPREGWGLGLALVKALTEQHAAGFELTSRPDGGTRAMVTFPAVRVKQSVASPRLAAAG